MSEYYVSMAVNGETCDAYIDPRMTLLDFLRVELGLVGTHAGCEHGVCGTCTVMMNGRTARACLVLAAQAHQAEILTVEGLAENGMLGPLQQAFWNKQALQCGYCTPGMLMRATELLRASPNPTYEEIREGLSSNLCRCTGYAFIIEAVLEAAERLRDPTMNQPMLPW